MRRADVPNALTLARVALSLVLFVLLTPRPWGPLHPGLASSDRAWLAAGAFVFALAALTDALDGHLARRWKVISKFGRVMDPFADKLLVLGSFVALAGPAFVREGAPLSGVTPWVCLAILGRELLVTSLRGVLEGEGVDFSAVGAGKAKMVLQSVCVPGVLVLLAIEPEAPGRVAHWTILGLVWATTAATVISGIPYVLRAVRPKRRA